MHCCIVVFVLMQAQSTIVLLVELGWIDEGSCRSNDNSLEWGMTVYGGPLGRMTNIHNAVFSCRCGWLSHHHAYAIRRLHAWQFWRVPSIA